MSKQMTIALSQEDVSLLNKGLNVVTEAFENCKVVSNFVTEVKFFMDNTSNGVLVETTNKSIPEFADSFLKLEAANTDVMRGIFNGMFTNAQRNKDDAMQKRIKKIVTELEERSAAIRQKITILGQSRVKLSDEVIDPPISIEKTLAAIQRISKMPKDFEALMESAKDFTVAARKTDYLSSHEEFDNAMKTYIKGLYDLVNGRCITVGEAFCNNIVDFIKQYQSIMSKDQQAVMENLTNVFRTSGMQLDENVQAMKKTKAEFVSPTDGGL
jgi:hypothetical protein